MMIGVIVFLASLLGMVASPTGSMATFWPANAVLLGLLLRVPRLSTPLRWILAMAGFVLAGLATSNTLLNSAAMGAINLLSVAVGYGMYKGREENIRRLKRSRAVAVMMINVLCASIAAALAGEIIDAVLFHRTTSPVSSGLFRFITEAANYIAILPVILSAPRMSWRWLERRRHIPFDIELRRSLPAVAVLLSCAISTLIGSSAMITFPIPALLWCAVTYNVFSSALLTLGFNIWALMTVSTGIFHPASSDGLINSEMSIRIAVAVLALAPISLAVVMESRNELMRRLRDIASRDQLTGLLNRHAFREQSNVLLNRLEPNTKPTSLLMINIDHFKTINDTHGYAAGDQALRSFSMVVSACLRNSDLFGRLGGEEFAVLLPDCAPRDAHMVAERIRKAILETPLNLGNNLQHAVTASIGIASTAVALNDIDPLLMAADGALYRAKKAGRNNVMESESGRDTPH